MIFVDRKSVRIPAAFGSKSLAKEILRAKAFFARPKQSRVQERFDFSWPAKVFSEIRVELETLFHTKCAYCETPLGYVGRGNIEQFRPKSAPSGLLPWAQLRTETFSNTWIADGDADRDPYWWLAFEWENLYFVCETCSRHKGSQFPVLGRRAASGAKGKALRTERALLLDPCVDRPEKHLDFHPDGHVTARNRVDQKGFGGLNRGQITVDLLALNRPELLNSRRRVATDLRRQWEALIKDSASGGSISDALAEMLHPARAYAGMGRQLIATWRYESPAMLSQVPTAIRRVFRATGLQEDMQTTSAQDVRNPKPEKKPIARIAESASRQQTVGFIKKIRIQNFKAIRDITIEVPIGTKERMGWKVLLGENGTGKSSILQATAFALMGSAFVRSHLRAFRLEPSELLRKIRGHQRATAAFIKIEFSTGEKCGLKISADGIESMNEPPVGVFIRGFGATRLLPRRNTAPVAVTKGELAKVTNLFEPTKPVFDAIRWLTGLRSGKEFGSAALSLKDLLKLPQAAKLRVNSGRVEVPIDGLKHSLDELSSGYESVLVIAADIIAGHLGRLQDFSRAPGVVLLDEIDAHLHPRWKMRIVDSLRRSFPSMQFIVTTHDPLCLRGAEENEAVVLERFGRKIEVLEDLPNPNSMRVDQLLTSNFFGLGSTIDPTTEDEFERYYALLATPIGRLTSEQVKQRNVLRQKLAKYEYRLMADTPQDEIILEAIDEYVAKDIRTRKEERESLPRLRAETKARIGTLLRDFKRQGGSVR